VRGGNVIEIVLKSAPGGGSIAWIDEQRRMHVGPRSAGSTPPGPSATREAGCEPTVTDANLALGRPKSRSISWRARWRSMPSLPTAIDERLAGPLGYTGDDRVTRAAQGHFDTCHHLRMSDEAIKQISVARRGLIHVTLLCSATARRAAARCRPRP